MDRQAVHLDEISLRGAVKELLRNFWMILLTAAAVWLGATGVGKLVYSPQYTSSATLAVTERGGGSSYSSLLQMTEMAAVFSEVFESDELKATISTDLGERMEGTLSCSQIEETNLIVLNASASTPRQAYQYIHSALEHYESVSEYVFSNASLQTVQEPSVPESPSNSSRLIRLRNLLTAAGAVGICAVILLFYLFRFTVKTPEGAARQLDGTVQGIIPYEKRGRKKKRKTKEAPLLTSPLVSMDYSEALRRMEARVERHMRRKKQKVLLIVSVGENEGKSTVAANIALAMAEKHKKVLLLEGDLRKPAQHKVFDELSVGRISFSEVLAGKVGWREAAVRNAKNGVRELFQFQPVAEPSRILDLSLLKRLLEEMKQEMDYIIVDTPPTAVAADAELWMQVCDTALLVVREDWSDVRAVNDTVDLIWQSSGDFAGFVLNAFRGKTVRNQYGYGEYAGHER